VFFHSEPGGLDCGQLQDKEGQWHGEKGNDCEPVKDETPFGFLVWIIDLSYNRGRDGFYKKEGGGF
jgi:hypothetical protein